MQLLQLCPGILIRELSSLYYWYTPYIRVFFSFYLPCFSSSFEQCIDLSTCKLLCTHTDTQLITHSCHLMSESKNNNAAHAHIRLPIYMPYMCRYVQCVFSINQETVHLHKQQQFCENPFQNTPRNNFLFAKYWQVIHQGILWKIKERKENSYAKTCSFIEKYELFYLSQRTFCGFTDVICDGNCNKNI